MWSVPEALERFIQSLELTPAQQQAATEQHTRLRGCLRQKLGTTDFLSGSYSRNTAIRPLHDIDVFVVMGEARWTPSGPLLQALEAQSPLAPALLPPGGSPRVPRGRGESGPAREGGARLESLIGP